MQMWQGVRVGWGVTGSFCTLDNVYGEIEKLVQLGAEVTPIFSEAVDLWDTRFGTAQHVRSTIETICGNKALSTVTEVEPIGPKKTLDILVVAPCTGNTMAKIAHGIVDTSVSMAVKAHLRNERPVVLALASNDALGLGAVNWAKMLNARNVYFTPLSQDDPIKKPRSMVAHTEKILESMEKALEGQQMQPLLDI